VWEEANSAAHLQPDPGIRPRPLEILDISIPTPSKSWKKNERNKANGLTPDHPALSLSDIEEGMSSAVEEGNRDKEYTTLKDGRYLVKYYLSDIGIVDRKGLCPHQGGTYREWQLDIKQR
jgi:hypothetical protein